MLVLGRKLGEAVIIDGRIRVSVGAIWNRNSSNPKVTLCIEAPKEVVVDREERHEKKMRECAKKVLTLR